jgi:ribonuclease HI
MALTEALKLSKEQRVNIYTDSKYAFLIQLTTVGSPIRRARDILALLDAVLLPKRSVIHCKDHQKEEDKIAKGNKAPNEPAKWAAMQEYTAGPLLWRGCSFPQRDHVIGQRKLSKPQTKDTN